MEKNNEQENKNYTYLNNKPKSISSTIFNVDYINDKEKKRIVKKINCTFEIILLKDFFIFF